MKERIEGFYALVPVGELAELIEAAHQFWALECGGVDNWEWYGESCITYLEDYIRENENEIFEADIGFEDEFDLEDFGFTDIVDVEIDNYNIISFQ